MKNILIPSIFPLEGSGSGQYSLDLAYWLSKKDCKPTILCTSNDKTTLHGYIHAGTNGKDKYSDIILKEIHFPKHSLIEFPAYTGHNLQENNYTFRDMTMEEANLYIKIFKEAILENIDGQDYIVCNHIAPLSGMVAELVEEEGLDIQAIQIAHGTAIKLKQDCVNGLSARDTFKDKQVYDKFFVELFEKGKKYVSRTVAISKHSHQQLMSLNFHDTEIYCRFNGFDPENFRVIPKIDKHELLQRTEEGITQKKNAALLTLAEKEYKKHFNKNYLQELNQIFQYKYLFVFTGKFTTNPDGTIFKGIDRIIEAAKILREQRNDFAIIFCGNGEKHVEMIKMSYSLGLDNLFYIGFQDNASVIPYWNNLAVAGLYPSRNEPFGLVAIECAACGTPPITTKGGGFLSFVEECGGSLVADFPNELAEKMDKSIKENWKETRKKLFSESINYSWIKIADELHKLIEGITK
ncbi:MAG: glycosyltransferase [Verrucomicrobiota bacterium]|nr:glycosyltransferase [Verrucomicrobiota bacterium]